MNLRYHINQLKSFKDLESSLLEISQIEPIVFFKEKDKEYIVDGLKRYNILKKHDIEIKKQYITKFLPLFIYILNSKDIHDSTIWKYLHILRHKNYSEKDIYNSFIKKHLKLSLRDIWKLLQIEYNEETEKLITELDINLKELMLYYEFEQKYFINLLNLFKTLNLNRNNRRDIFILISEILKRDKLTLTQLLKQEKLDEIINSDIQINDKISLFKKELFSIRYPLMVKEITILTNLKNKIKTPGFKLDLPIDKESNRCNISFQFRNKQELERKINALNELSDNEYLNEILEKINNR